MTRLPLSTCCPYAVVYIGTWGHQMIELSGIAGTSQGRRYPSGRARARTHTHTHLHTRARAHLHTHTHTHIYLALKPGCRSTRLVYTANQTPLRQETLPRTLYRKSEPRLQGPNAPRSPVYCRPSFHRRPTPKAMEPFSDMQWPSWTIIIKECLALSSSEYFNIIN